MRSFILLCVVCLQIRWSYGEPKGVGAFAYQDTNGNRYGGTYGLDDAQVNQRVGEFIPPFAQPFQTIDDFFPEYFNNLENLLKEASSRRASFRKARALDPLPTSIDLQRTTRSIFSPFPPLEPKAPLPPLPYLKPLPPLPPLQPLPPLLPLKPFPPLPPLKPLPPLQPLKPLPPLPPLTPLSPLPPLTPLPPLPPLIPFPPLPPLKPLPPLPPLIPFEPFPPLQPLEWQFSRYNDYGGFAGFPNFGFNGQDMNSAFASGMVGPGMSHQIAALNPENPRQPNVNVVNRFADTGNPDNRFYSVQTSSYSTSSNVGGKRTDHKGAETIVNQNGHITEYKITS